MFYLVTIFDEYINQIKISHLNIFQHKYNNFAYFNKNHHVVSALWSEIYNCNILQR